MPRGEAMGRATARLHRIAQGSRFGWHRGNFIGRTPQVNDWDDDWARFFRDRRLRPQFELASAYGLRGADALLDAVSHLLADHAPAPSLLPGFLQTANKPQKMPVVEMGVMWRSHIDYLPDPTRNGELGPGLAAEFPQFADKRLRVFTEKYKKYIVATTFCDEG